MANKLYTQLFILFFLLTMMPMAYAIGVSPTILNFDGALPGETLTSYLYVSNNLQEIVDVELVGNITDWITYTKSTFIEHETKKQTRFDFLIDIPLEALPGNYSCNVRFQEKSSNKNSGQTTISTGVQSIIFIEVKGIEFLELNERAEDNLVTASVVLDNKNTSVSNLNETFLNEELLGKLKNRTRIDFLILALLSINIFIPLIKKAKNERKKKN